MTDAGTPLGFAPSPFEDVARCALCGSGEPAIARLAQEALGAARVHVGDLAAAPLEPASYDLVTLWDVVEHAPVPVALLRRVGDLLKPDGRVVLETQNVDSRADAGARRSV